MYTFFKFYALLIITNKIFLYTTTPNCSQAKIRGKDTQYIANGLMDIVKKVNKVEDFKAELGQVVEAISDDVLVYFNNPTITLGEKSKTIAQFCK